MKKKNVLIVTPEKLANPVKIVTKSNVFNKIHDYLSVSHCQKRVFKSHNALHLPKPHSKDPIFLNLSQFSSSQKYSMQNRSSQITRKPKNMKNLIMNENSMKTQHVLPQLSYRNFEKSHSPRAKVVITTFTPRMLPQRYKENEEVPEVLAQGPTRIEIEGYSKEFSSRLSRVHEVIKMVENEHSL